MSALKTAKLFTLSVGKSMGIFQALGRSDWRKNQLLILAYHGVSQDDEHLWNSDLYISPEHFRNRMKALKGYGCNVLPLAEGLERLQAGTLPRCSVVLTFDDGGCDFYKRAFPILQEFGWPATVYLASYYSNYNRPVFDVMCSYLLWKGQGTVLNVKGLMNGEAEFDLRTLHKREKATFAIRAFARAGKFSARKKDDLLSSLAERLSVDYESILSKRILHLLSPEEVAQLAAQGVDIQLHTHRHHAPTKRESFLIELEENKKFISRFAKAPSHFSYPHGVYEKCYDGWLGASGVASATTCEPGLATTETNPYKLPRLVDTSSLTQIELEGWVSGFSKFLPRKPTRAEPLIPPYYY